MRREKTQSIGEILQEVTKDKNIGSKLDEMKLIEAWPVVVGEALNSYTTHLSIYNKVLFVSLTSAVLRSELMMHKTQLIYKLNKEVGRIVINNIIFK